LVNRVEPRCDLVNGQPEGYERSTDDGTGATRSTGAMDDHTLSCIEQAADRSSSRDDAFQLGVGIARHRTSVQVLEREGLESQW
jgi:hypothetical protein